MRSVLSSVSKLYNSEHVKKINEVIYANFLESGDNPAEGAIKTVINGDEGISKISKCDKVEVFAKES